MINWGTGEYDEDHVTPIDAELTEYALWASTQRNLTGPLRDGLDALRLINISFDWLTRSERADTFVAMLSTCATTLVAQARRGTSRVGRCTAQHPERDICGGPLELVWDATFSSEEQLHSAPNAVECQWCSDRWELADLINIGRVTPLNVWETPPNIAAMLGMPERTLRHWIATRKVRKNGLGMVCHAEVWRILKERNDPQQRLTAEGLLTT